MRKNKFTLLAITGIILLVFACENVSAAQTWSGRDYSYINAQGLHWYTTISSTLNINMNDQGAWENTWQDLDPNNPSGYYAGYSYMDHTGEGDYDTIGLVTYGSSALSDTLYTRYMASSDVGSGYDLYVWHSYQPPGGNPGNLITMQPYNVV